MEKKPDLRLISRRAAQVAVHHPDTRAPQRLSLEEFLFRVETSLGLALEPHWTPILVAMADGLYLKEAGILERAWSGQGYVERQAPPDANTLHAGTIDELREAGVIVGRQVEEIFRLGEWASLERPRSWELNGWWEALYGAIPMPPAQEEADEDEEEVEGDGLELGSSPHPFGLQSPDNQVRLLLERGLLNQDDTLFRLRVSIFEQERALRALRGGWRLDGEGTLALPAPEAVSARAFEELEVAMGAMNRGERRFDPEAIEQLIPLGLARRAQGYTLAL